MPVPLLLPWSMMQKASSKFTSLMYERGLVDVSNPLIFVQTNSPNFEAHLASRAIIEMLTDEINNVINDVNAELARAFNPDNLDTQMLEACVTQLMVILKDRQAKELAGPKLVEEAKTSDP